MSVDLAVWEGAAPATDEQAVATFERLARRYLDLKLNDVFEDGWRFCVETASSEGLVAFDPQSGRLANPDPNAPSSDEPLPPRPGPVYRWLSLRAWRWPFLKPLLPLARRLSREDRAAGR